MSKSTNAPLWTVLPEKPRHEPLEARALFSRQKKGSPRIFFNLPACTAFGLAVGKRLQILAPADANGKPTIGLRVVSGGEGARLRPAGNTRSLCLVTSALPHLVRQYLKIEYRPRAGRDGEPPIVLEPTRSEKGAASE